MHELSIVQNIIEIVIKEKQNNSAEKVLKISLKIGDFSNIVPETLRFCFDILKNENNLSQTTLEIENVPLRVRCLACGRISGAKQYSLVCPECEHPGTEIVSGQELQIESIEIE